MATVRKRGKKFEVQIRRKGFNTLCRTFHRRSDAAEWARFMETRADRGELPTPIKVLEQHTVKSILERYKKEISVKKLSYCTEKYVLDGLMRQTFSNLSVAEMTVAKICDYRDMRLRVVQPGTIRRELAILKHAFDIAEREWNIPIKQNPLNKIAKVKPQAGRNRRLIEGEYKALQDAISEAHNPFLRSLIQLAIETAMRRGEILRLQWTNIDFKARTLFIPITKNGYSRTIPLTTEAITILQELQRKNNEGQLVFPVSSNAAQLAWQRLTEKAGVVNLHFHDLRHEAISRFFERGLSVAEVALISGHRDFRMLFRYTHLKPEDIAIKLMGSTDKKLGASAGSN